MENREKVVETCRGSFNSGAVDEERMIKTTAILGGSGEST